ncbi:uncharacterized protein CIMG_12820 [Coccidioides immitis RS]|uniref:Uncharacterized protein n=1 Tax=Coccidioides immitis (strain RS) TaxID=246410 RepID=J3KI13_COCIM|nr:uncharacterized protein CIMG_12820 [Coccidioides immitis RS]EAS35555.3 hypothetical protein CIMG_12820 [Coccidioides immitis RS]
MSFLNQFRRFLLSARDYAKYLVLKELAVDVGPIMYLEDFARLILSEIEESLHNSYGKRHPYLAITWNLYGVPVLQGTLPRRACENSTWDVMGNPNKRVSVNKLAKFLNRV